MESHRLALEYRSRPGTWLLRCDDVLFVIESPEGELAFEVSRAHAHRHVDLDVLCVEGKIRVDVGGTALKFTVEPATVAAVLALVGARLGDDHEYRRQLQWRSFRMAPLALAESLVAGSLFGLYCWYAIGRPDSPSLLPRVMLAWQGPLISILLFLLLGLSLGAPCWCYF